MGKVKVGIIGGTGYVGLELLRLLKTHAGVEITSISSVSYEGEVFSKVQPSFNQILDVELDSIDDAIKKADILFLCLPHSHSEKIASKAKGKIIIDLGADFRLEDEKTYEKWYGSKFSDPSLHESAIYSIPELAGDKLKGKTIVANPGCYPTSIILALAPILTSNINYSEKIFISAASGITGAGRTLSEATHFPRASEGFNAYKIGNHRHIPEIEQELSKLSNKKIKINLATHLLPVNRGILSTIFLPVDEAQDKEALYQIYKDFYKENNFVRIIDEFSKVNINNIKMSNYCDIALTYDDNTSCIVIVSAIDNMVKGAAGQAIQNMNILLNFPEDMGLNVVPTVF